MAQHTILSTKKLDPALKAAMEQKGVEVMEEEFIAIKPIFTKNKIEEVWQLATTYQHEVIVVFTSQHAAATVDKFLHYGFSYVQVGWKAFCLEGATKKQVLKVLSSSVEQIIDTAPNAAELAAKIIAHGQYKQVVFFCGNQRRDELPCLLKEAGIEVIEIVVYETVATPVLATDNFSAVLFFSPSAVKSFFSVNTLKKDTACFAIGDTTAATIGDYTDNRVITSEQPYQEIMLTSVWFYLQNIDLYK